MSICYSQTEELMQNTRCLLEQTRKVGERADELASDALGQIITWNAQNLQNGVQAFTALATQTAKRSAANIEVGVSSTLSILNATRTLSLDWLRFAQNQVEQGFDRLRSGLDQKAPEQFAAFYTKPFGGAFDVVAAYARQLEEAALRARIELATATEESAGEERRAA